ncbi:MAG: ATP-binding protein [Kiloniellales bacterium]
MAAARLTLLCEYGVWLQFSLVLSCGLALLVLDGTVPVRPLQAIVVIILLAVAAQALLTNRYRETKVRSERVGLWTGLYALTLLAAGLAWGAAGFLFVPLLEADQQTLLALTVLGQAMLSLAVCAWYPPAAMAFLLPALLPTALGFVSAGPAPSIATGATALMFMVALGGLGWFLNRRFCESVTRQLDDRDFIERLLTGRASENAVQARLETALESMSEALAVFDAEDRLVICNSRFLGEQRAGRANDLVGISFEELVSRDIGNAGIVNAIGREAEYVAERLEYHRTQVGTFEIELSDGRWLQVRDRSTRDGGTVIVQTDITAYRHAEKKLRAAKEKAELANRSKSELLANTSHELRTPLNAIIGFSEVMESEIFGPLGSQRYIEYAKDIHKSGEYLIRVIDDLLDLAKIEAGKHEPADDTVDLERSIATAVNITHGQAKAAKVTVKVRIEPNLPRLRADQRMVQQILLNLLSNALKFTPPAGRVEISAEACRSGELVIKVSDTGVGMSAEDLERAFEPFGRAKGALVRNFEGTGLGLPLTRSLVNLHGGLLEIESTPDVGTLAIVSFPAQRVLFKSRMGA